MCIPSTYIRILYITNYYKIPTIYDGYKMGMIVKC